MTCLQVGNCWYDWGEDLSTSGIFTRLEHYSRGFSESMSVSEILSDCCKKCDVKCEMFSGHEKWPLSWGGGDRKWTVQQRGAAGSVHIEGRHRVWDTRPSTMFLWRIWQTPEGERAREGWFNKSYLQYFFNILVHQTASGGSYLSARKGGWEPGCGRGKDGTTHGLEALEIPPLEFLCWWVGVEYFMEDTALNIFCV